LRSVAIKQLRELWVHTGTACNLECPFCLEGSRPGDTRLERVTLADIKPYLDGAAQLNVERFVFTGGEPLIVKDIVKILDYALQLKPCLVLTNGTAPLLKRVHQLQSLKQQAHALSFRISIDHADEKQHDAARGWGNFKRAIDGLKLLHKEGFAVSVARHAVAAENVTAIEAQYRALFKANRLPLDMPLNPLPELGRPQASLTPEIVPINDADVSNCHSSLMCSETRMVVKHSGQLNLQACPFTDDDPRFNTGLELRESMSQSVALQHARCVQCVRHSARL
jgi:molybdenum cofactor biosynthesis enzyme MoaA